MNISYTGIVQAGSKHAAALGYPTVNIPLSDSSVSGVYIARIKLGEEEYEAVAFADTRRDILEAHVLDFAADLYGWNVTITLIKKIRERKSFSDDASLKVAIDSDVAAAREYFKRN